MAVFVANVNARIPQDRLVFTVVSVTVLSTVTMILYPVLVRLLGMDDLTAGVYLGATIHDVAQVVGAGFSVSEPTGETATLVKLLRVAMLAPIVMLGAVFMRRSKTEGEDVGTRPPLLPGFLIIFVVLCSLNSLGLIPSVVTNLGGTLSRWMLLIAIAAVGLKTRPAEILKVGLPAVWMIMAETVFLAVLILGGLMLAT